MTHFTCALVLFPKPLKSGSFSIALRVTFQRKSKYFFLSMQCLKEDWDKDAARLRKTAPDWRKDNDLLRTYEQRAADILRDFKRDGVAFTFERFSAAMFGAAKPAVQPAAEYILGICQQLRNDGRYGNSRFYRHTANTVQAFSAGAVLADIDGAWLARFERFLNTNRDLNPGGKSIILRTLRAACNRAVKEGLMPRAWYPFADYSLAHLTKGKAKKAAGLDFVAALEGAGGLSDTEDLARNLFLFSFYCRGMNLADICSLRRQDVAGGVIMYRRQKTWREYVFKLPEKAQGIISKYARPGIYCFPIYDEKTHHTPAQQHSRRNKIATKVNRALRNIAKRMGFDIPRLSFYTARHTYAHSLKLAGVSLEVVSEALGHADIKTTDAYLKTFGNDVLAAADALLGIK